MEHASPNQSLHKIPSKLVVLYHAVRTAPINYVAIGGGVFENFSAKMVHVLQSQKLPFSLSFVYRIFGMQG